MSYPVLFPISNCHFLAISAGDIGLVVVNETLKWTLVLWNRAAAQGNSCIDVAFSTIFFVSAPECQDIVLKVWVQPFLRSMNLTRSFVKGKGSFGQCMQALVILETFLWHLGPLSTLYNTAVCTFIWIVCNVHVWVMAENSITLTIYTSVNIFIALRWHLEKYYGFYLWLRLWIHNQDYYRSARYCGASEYMYKTRSSCMHMTDQDVTETSGHRIWHTKSTNTCVTQEWWVRLEFSEAVQQVWVHLLWIIFELTHDARIHTIRVQVIYGLMYGTYRQTFRPATTLGGARSGLPQWMLSMLSAPAIRSACD